jgi:hypothetical protein
MTQLPASFPCLRKKNVKLSSGKLWLNVILFLQLIGEERDMEWKVSTLDSQLSLMLKYLRKVSM